MVGDRELEEMTRNTFMPKNGARVLDRRADVEVLRPRIIGRDEIEAGGSLS